MINIIRQIEVYVYAFMFSVCAYVPVTVTAGGNNDSINNTVYSVTNK